MVILILVSMVGLVICTLVLRIITRGHCSANCATDSPANDGTIATTHFITDRGARCPTNPATNGGIQGRTVRTHIRSGHK
jgi:hypothetical protein